MQHGEDLEVTVRTSTRELAIYVVFLSILVIGTSCRIPNKVIQYCYDSIHT